MPEATPISRPPSSVPGRLPTPPTMMATKLGISRFAPMVGSRLSCPAASTPDRPARNVPSAKLKLRRLRTLTPSADTVSRSMVPARMRMPTRVKRRNRNRPVITSATTATMNRRYWVTKKNCALTGCDRKLGTVKGIPVAPQIARVMSSKMKASPKVSRRL
jgi:hypothetical protein